MTPERRRDFEEQWPAIEARLKSLLARKKIPYGERDDLVQETALRLCGMWDRVDPSRSPWPLAVTIVLNLVRDASRRRPILEVSSADVPDVPDLHEVERAGIARIELGRVREALGSMSPAYRSALLVEVGDAAAVAGSSKAAEKMTRVRARRQLVQLVEKVSALFPLRLLKELRWQWVGDMGQWFAGAREGVLASIPCLACLAVGVTTVVASTIVTPQAATANTLHPHASTSSRSTAAVAHAPAPRAVTWEVHRNANVPEVDRGSKETRAHDARPQAKAAAADSEDSSSSLPTPPDTSALPIDPPSDPGGNGEGGGNPVVQRVKDDVSKVTGSVALSLPRP